MTATPEIVGHALLRDYPVHLWAQQQEHFAALLREFQLLLVGETAHSTHPAPRQLVELADLVTTRYGPLIEAVTAERQHALARGLDRFDIRVPIVEGTPALLDQAERVLRAVDEFCRSGDLLVLPRPPELVALSEWTAAEIVRQYEGGEPMPWPGPF